MKRIQSLVASCLFACALQAKPITHPTVVTTIGNVGDSPSGSALTPDNKYLYVAIDNNDGLPNADSVAVISTVQNKLIQTIYDPSFQQPYTVTMNKAGTKAYITNSNSSTITIINTANNAVSGVIPGFDGPSGMVITPDQSTGYVNNYGGPGGVMSGNGRSVYVVNLNTNLITATINVNLAPAALAIAPSGAYVYVADYVDGNLGTGLVEVIRTSDNKITATITGFSGPFDIAITPNGQYAFVTNFGSNNFSPVGTTVSVINLSNNTVIANIYVGIQPAGIAFSPDGRYAYITIYDTLYLGAGFTDLTAAPGIVVIIDICTLKVVSCPIPVGASPSNITISSDGARAYVSNYTGDSVTVLNILERMWLTPNSCCPTTCCN